MYWNRWAQRALNYLPPYSADTAEVYAAFFDNFGTGVITSSSTGAMVEVISRFPYYLVRLAALPWCSSHPETTATACV